MYISRYLPQWVVSMQQYHEISDYVLCPVLCILAAHWFHNWKLVPLSPLHLSLPPPHSLSSGNWMHTTMFLLRIILRIYESAFFCPFLSVLSRADTPLLVLGAQVLFPNLAFTSWICLWPCGVVRYVDRAVTFFFLLIQLLSYVLG